MMGRSRWWLVQASIMGTCVAVAIAAGIVGIPRELVAKPLDEAAPTTAAELQSAAAEVSAFLDEVSGKVDEDTGVGTDPADESAPAGAGAYAATWLTTESIPVQGVTTLTAQCRTLIDQATTVLDPAKTLVGSKRQANPDATPQIVALDGVMAMPGALGDCRRKVELALSTMDEALAAAKTDAANQAATTAYTAQIDSLTTALSDAQDTLSGSTIAAAADARTSLSAQIDAAQTLVNADQPTTWQDLDQQTTNLVQAAQSLADAVSALEAVQPPTQSAQTYTGGNGRLDPSTLCQVPYDTKQLLRCDAEAAWMRLDAAYKDVWGVDIPIDLSYRTYDEQVEMKQIYGSGAATPGYSNHGWGTAVDLPDYREGGEGLEWNYGTEKYEWMKANAPAYNWVNPSWAVQGGVGPHEPWHFEYVG